VDALLSTLMVRDRLRGTVTFTLVGGRETPVGGFTREIETVPVKPPCGTMVSRVLPLLPFGIERLVGLRKMAKSGAGVTVRVRLAVLVRVPEMAVS
jgi:hypothetical protein